MDQKFANRTLKLALVNLPSRTEAMLELFFNGAGRGTFVRADEASADAILFDQDHQESRHAAERLRSDKPVPQLGLAMNPGQDAGVIWLSKPLSTQSLFEGAAQLRNRLGGDLPVVPNAPVIIRAPGVDAAPKASAAPTPSSASGASDAAAPNLLNVAGTSVITGKMSAALAADVARSLTPEPDDPALNGSRADLPLEKMAGNGAIYFNPAQHLPAAISEAIVTSKRWKAPVQVIVTEGVLTISADEGTAVAHMTADDLAKLCAKPMTEQAKFHVVSPSDAHAADLTASLPPARDIGLQPLIWNSTLRASQGRLPAGTHPLTKVRLTRWPNLTRIERSPHTVAIAALWGARQVSLMDTASMLKIPQRYVFAVYSAALACDCLAIEIPAEQLQAQAAQERVPQMSLLERFIAWIGRLLT